ncbi:MFS transporter [Acidocella sp.]|uniref:MFS transporter n=1 Tax=Acidocella sp. TaxID=50710 RepID=UPI001840A7C9|nr:MFS transporter [Acidocella sp.]NNM55836.1 MFS transporter [Acidocella sp.]
MEQDEAEPVISERRMRLMAVIIATALFMQNLDSTVIATALPAMARSFHAPPLHMSVALTSYLISLSVFIPASGWVADHFGARQVFRIAIMIFTLASVACGMAPNLGFLVAARVVQGLGGAMMLPVGRLVLLRSVSRAQMVVAMSWLTMPALVGPILGPPLGGFIVTYFSWRWVFDINVPIGIIGVIAVSLFIPDSREAGRGGRLDSWGLILTGFAMAAMMAGFETAGRSLVPLSWTLGALAAGAGAVWLYLLHMRRHPQPVLDFSLLRIPTFANSVVAGSLFRIAVGALPFLLPLMLQLGFGKSPMQSGLITFASAAGALAMKPAAQPLLRRFGFRSVLMLNGFVAALFIMACASFQPGWPPLVLDGILLLGGFFRSLQFTAFNTIAYGDIPRARMSAATSLYSTIQQLTLTLGIVVGATTLELSARWHQHAVAMKSDYAMGFIVVGLFSMMAVPFCARLRPDAGQALSGHRG